MRDLDQVAAGEPQDDRTVFRASRRSLLGAAGAGILALAAGARTPAAGQTPAPEEIAVFPMHGTRTASPGTEISFRGVALDALGAVEVVGSWSGGHSGLLMPHSDGEGVSFVPDARFLAGERVTVRADLPLRASPSGSVTFRVSTPGTPDRKTAAREIEQPASQPQEFRTRLDLPPPVITITTAAIGTAPGHTFVAAKVPDGRNGAMIVDDQGDLVWFGPVESDIAEHNDFRVQQYRGEPVLTMWEGVSELGTGFGHLVIRNSRYEVVSRLQVGNGYFGMGLHECLLTPRGSVLILIYNPVLWDLSAVGGAEDGTALDSVIQELDIETGRVLFEWHSIDHIAFDESFQELPEETDAPWDYVHFNSVGVDAEGNLIVSARHSHAIYKIERRTGRVLWRLNGKRSDFAMGDGAPFRFQHDARAHGDGELTLFDNADSDNESDLRSRGKVLQLDESALTATLVREYPHPDEVLAISQGNLQVLPNGNVFMGWGNTPIFSEFDVEGNLIFNGRFPQGTNSYRAYRFPWVGAPVDLPDVAVESGLGDRLTVWASWNGATEVASWQVVAGADPEALEPVGQLTRTGFETMIEVATAEPYLAVQALDADGEVIGASAPIMPRG